jgi:hypothetical protein
MSDEQLISRKQKTLFSEQVGIKQIGMERSCIHNGQLGAILLPGASTNDV